MIFLRQDAVFSGVEVVWHIIKGEDAGFTGTSKQKGRSRGQSKNIISFLIGILLLDLSRKWNETCQMSSLWFVVPK